MRDMADLQVVALIDDCHDLTIPCYMMWRYQSTSQR